MGIELAMRDAEQALAEEADLEDSQATDEAVSVDETTMTDDRAVTSGVAEDDAVEDGVAEGTEAAASSDSESTPAEDAILSTTENKDAPDAKVVLPPDQEGVAHTSDTTGIKNVFTPAATVVPARAIDLFGYPNSALAVAEMYDDLVKAMNTRRVTNLYAQWKRYNSSVLNRTRAKVTGSELNGRSRLRWYEQLYREPLSSVMEVENYTRSAYTNFSGSAADIIRGIRDARVKMDLAPSQIATNAYLVSTPEEALAVLATALDQAVLLQKRALAPLTDAEVKMLANELFSVFTSSVRNGHTLPMISRAKYLVDVMDKMDRGSMYDAAELLLPITNQDFLDQLARVNTSALESLDHGNNKIYRIPTAAGDILIGGPEDNVWNLDAIANVLCVIDLGGNDTYIEGICNVNRPVFVVLDLGQGNDKYTATRPGVQGSSILGVSLWYNEGGNNSYSARSLAQGSTIGGVGILIDNAGDDSYVAFFRGQGTALYGLGLMIDRAGSDDYRSAMLAQGLGQPGGFAAIVDVAGNDHYYVGGYYTDSYPEHPGYDGWGQGIGTGIRGVACGGIGLLLEGEGDDTYEYDYFAHGGGYWMGVGAARDFAGNDRRLGATLLAYNKQPRTEKRWQRFSNGFGCHYAMGYLFDDAGNDSYNGTIMGLGMAWDLSAGFLVDFDGTDVFEATGGLTQGVGAEGSIGVLMAYRGEKTYRGSQQGYASSKLTYHSQYDCGANFSFVVDHGGTDVYGCRARNNAMSQRGMATGFVIDRPTTEELAALEAEQQRKAEEALAAAEAAKLKAQQAAQARAEAAKKADKAHVANGQQTARSVPNQPAPQPNPQQQQQRGWLFGNPRYPR
ncbi:MAG: hypothetical protein Q4G68_14330 [Planctomycetia bacterium]|nr:hypothetical protein [Planctomycetia bacterium]